MQRSVKVHATDNRIKSDAGLILLPEADHRLGITESLARGLFVLRHPDRIRYQIVELLREWSYSLAMVYSVHDDVDRRTHDPAMRMAAWNPAGEQPMDERMAIQPTQSLLIHILSGSPEKGKWCVIRLPICASDISAPGEEITRHGRSTSTSTVLRSPCMATNPGLRGGPPRFSPQFDTGGAWAMGIVLPTRPSTGDLPA